MALVLTLLLAATAGFLVLQFHATPPPQPAGERASGAATNLGGAEAERVSGSSDGRPDSTNSAGIAPGAAEDRESIEATTRRRFGPYRDRFKPSVLISPRADLEVEDPRVAGCPVRYTDRGAWIENVLLAGGPSPHLIVRVALRERPAATQWPRVRVLVRDWIDGRRIEREHELIHVVSACPGHAPPQTSIWRRAMCFSLVGLEAAVERHPEHSEKVTIVAEWHDLRTKRRITISAALWRPQVRFPPEPGAPIEASVQVRRIPGILSADVLLYDGATLLASSPRRIEIGGESITERGEPSEMIRDKAITMYLDGDPDWSRRSELRAVFRIVSKDGGVFEATWTPEDAE